jgi:hypothetical protein
LQSAGKSLHPFGERRLGNLDFSPQSTVAFYTRGRTAPFPLQTSFIKMVFAGAN